MTGKTHKIKTINQLSKVITPENFANFMIDFTAVMIDLVQRKQSLHKQGYAYTDIELTHYEWTDDSERGLKKIIIHNKDAEDDVLVFDQFIEGKIVAETNNKEDKEPK